MGINSLMSHKIKSLENTDSRNINYIQYSTNTNQNKNHLQNNEKTEINLNTKKLGNKKNLMKTEYYTTDVNSHKKLVNRNKIGNRNKKIKNINEKNKFCFIKIRKNNKCKINSFFQNKIISKKSNNKILNNSKEKYSN